MKLEEFLKCEHDIECDSSMTSLYCVKCGQDANVINHVKKQSKLLKKLVSQINQSTVWWDGCEEFVKEVGELK